MSLTVRLPLSAERNPDGDYRQIVTYPTLVKQNLKILLYTIPGERVFDQDFGVGLPRFLFEPMNDMTYSMIDSRIQEQVSRYMPYLEVEEIQITPSEDMSLISIGIPYYVSAINKSDFLTIGINNAGINSTQESTPFSVDTLEVLGQNRRWLSD